MNIKPDDIVPEQPIIKVVSDNHLKRMMDDMPVAVMTVDPETLIITYANETSKTLLRSIEHLLPISCESLIGTCIDVFHRRPERQRQLLRDPANLPHSARIKLGPEVLDLNVTAVTSDDGAYLGPMLTWAIVTKQVAAERRIRQLAHYDVLTGLANRTRFNEKLNTRLSGTATDAALCYIDLDGFKLVNDARGHRLGDELLRRVAVRLTSVCNDPDIAIGRLGGDEFAVLIPHNNVTEIIRIATRIIESISEPYLIEQNRKVNVSASVGIAISPTHGTSSETLHARADIALYAAKFAGKATYKFFSNEMEKKIHEGMRLRARLGRSLETQTGLFVFFQPIVDARTEKVIAREALIRWHDAEYGWVSPADFIPVAEQSGLIDTLGRFVLERACLEASKWTDEAQVAVNISAAQLGKGIISPHVLNALEKSGLPPERLAIEVTETAMLNDSYGGFRDLSQLRSMGVGVALDDFGTGYSSLTHLCSFPFDKIKIDGSFVKAASKNAKSAAVVKTVADLGARLGVATVAEGVETDAQMRRVIQDGCTAIQGYYFGRPKPSPSDAATVAKLSRKRP